MSDHHAIQLTGSKCQGRNCACAACADAIAAGTGGKDKLTADQVRAESGESCVPGVHSASGGLFIGDVQRVAAAHGVTIDYGRDPVSYYERWNVSTLRSRLGTGWGAITLIDYDRLVKPYRADTEFLGDHSGWAHDYRTDLIPFGGTRAEPTYCWHDPLRKTPIRIPATALEAAWQKSTSPIRGFAGFVRLPAQPAPDTGQEDSMTAFAFRNDSKGKPLPSGTITVKGSGHSYMKIGGPDDGKLVAIAAGIKKRAHPITISVGIPNGDPGGRVGYLIGTGAAFIRETDVTFVPDKICP